MALVANLINIVGLIFLSHAYVSNTNIPFSKKTSIDRPPSVYSAYEHSLLASASTAPSLRLPNEADTTSKLSLPIDITLETLFSVLLLCVGVVLSSPDLKPIQWSAWAGNLERSKEARIVQEAGVAPGNPYAQLEDRPGFWDPRGARKAFGLWVTEGSKAGSS